MRPSLPFRPFLRVPQVRSAGLQGNYGHLESPQLLAVDLRAT